jgi:hypothetical protein
MVVLAVIIPLVMLGVLLALGRYEDLMLPMAPAEAADEPDGTLAPAVAGAGGPAATTGGPLGTTGGPLGTTGGAPGTAGGPLGTGTRVL